MLNSAPSVHLSLSEYEFLVSLGLGTGLDAALKIQMDADN